RVGQPDVILLEKSGKKTLRQILGVMRVVAMAPDKRVERKPVGPAKILQRCGSMRGQVLASGQHHAPMSRAKLRTTFRNGVRLGSVTGHRARGSTLSRPRAILFSRGRAFL